MYCKKPRHIIDNCWKLHGKPQAKNKGGIEQAEKIGAGICGAKIILREGNNLIIH